MSVNESEEETSLRPRVVIEHSGYDLLNIGDAAMLKACYQRVRNRWPEAQVHVICYRPEVLQDFCPGAIAVGPPLRNAAGMGLLPRRPKLAAEQVFKTLLPLMPVMQVHDRATDQAKTLRVAVADADAVIGAGGGYLCDKFWWHAVGVLATLRAAQRSGIPTAMFGQGIGPLRPGPIRNVITKVLKELDVLTLREARTGGPLLSSMGIVEPATMPTDGHPEVISTNGKRIELTGDDAFALALSVSPHRDEVHPTIGFNVRIGADSELSDTSGLGEAILDSATRHDADVVVLPVSRYDTAEDFNNSLKLLEDAQNRTPDHRVIADRMAVPQALAEAASKCSVVVSGSYHGAVFALSQGCPVVMLVANDYYAQKSSGLAELFPGLLMVVRMNREDQAERLQEAIEAAWNTSAEARREGRNTTIRYRQAADRAFGEFAEIVERRMRDRARIVRRRLNRRAAHRARQAAPTPGAPGTPNVSRSTG